jgi:hypothetical protein
MQHTAESKRECDAAEAHCVEAHNIGVRPPYVKKQSSRRTSHMLRSHIMATQPAKPIGTPKQGQTTKKPMNGQQKPASNPIKK